jgi:N-acetyl-anhydromuramyl-L-alanine amidase AmpD
MNKTLEQLNISDELPCNPDNFTPYKGRKITFIVIHYTGGTGTARANAKYYHDSADIGASAHYFVGHASEDGKIYRSVKDEDKAWHCGTPSGVYYSECRNTNSIGIEVACHNDTADKTATSKSWYFDTVTVDRLVELVRALMDKYYIDAAHVIRHYDVTRKLCPAMWVHDAAAWAKFKARLTGAASAIEIKPEPAVVDTPTLKLGSKGADVVTLQNRLNALGCPCGAADGDFGPRTESAVKAFQKKKKLVQDGVVGPKTWAALLK